MRASAEVSNDMKPRIFTLCDCSQFHPVKSEPSFGVTEQLVLFLNSLDNILYHKADIFCLIEDLQRLLLVKRSRGDI